jgi:hypothetical protein
MFHITRGAGAEDIGIRGIRLGKPFRVGRPAPPSPIRSDSWFGDRRLFTRINADASHSP